MKFWNPTKFFSSLVGSPTNLNFCWPEISWIYFNYYFLLSALLPISLIPSPSHIIEGPSFFFHQAFENSTNLLTFSVLPVAITKSEVLLVVTLTLHLNIINSVPPIPFGVKISSICILLSLGGFWIAPLLFF